MSYSDEIRKTLNLLESVEATVEEAEMVDTPAEELVSEGETLVKVGEYKDHDVRIHIATLTRQSASRGRYHANRSFLPMRDLLEDPGPHLERYRKETGSNINNLSRLLAGIKPNPKLTDKEKYLRNGYESRGFSDDKTHLIWFKDTVESLIILAASKTAHIELRDLFKFFNIIV